MTPPVADEWQKLIRRDDAGPSEMAEFFPLAGPRRATNRRAEAYLQSTLERGD